LKIVAIVNLLIVLGVIGIFFTFRPAPKFDPERAKEEFNQENIKRSQAIPLALPKMTINLASGQSKLHYLDTTIELLPLKNSLTETLKANDALIKSAIIETVGQMTFDQISNVSGKILLADQLKEVINLRLGIDGVQKILFTRFVVQ
jgi:flagellar basal body-associated protein FliL